LLPMCGMEFEWFNFAETPQSWAAKQGVAPEPITPGMFGYSLLRMNHRREFFNALMDEMPTFGVPIEGLHTETGPGVYEVAILFSEALEAADRAILFKTGAKEIGARFGVMPSFMAKWSAKYPGCSGHIHQSLKEGPDGKANLFYDAGNVYATARQFDPTRLFRGAGIGVSTITPLGPLGLDYGYGFDRLDRQGRPAPKWQLHFRLGQLF